jgi:cytochrome bd ubiquinol oxidase subunit I
MPNSTLSVFLSRRDFAWITSMHILYPRLTVGLSLLLFVAEWLWVRSNDESWYRLARFSEKLSRQSRQGYGGAPLRILATCTLRY